MIGELRTMPSRLRQRDSATYTCPAEKAIAASIITLSKLSPWLLCMVMAQARRSGIWQKDPSTTASISLLSGLSS